ncbi:MAG: hypothetical protein O3A63_08085 [Proteobacteria bacterium]|nr:hypothetical protein [Pseudomonadota bacterium]
MMHPLPLLTPRRAHRRWHVSVLLMCGLLGGCVGASVEVPATFPVPLVEKVPLTVGWHVDEALANYVHSESLEAQGQWEIILGPSQTTMFGNLATGLFQDFRWVDDPLVANPGLSAVFHPMIEELQFSTPEQTRSDYFEVWIRYQIKMYDNQGALLGEWPLTAYGKANEQNYGMSSDEPALQQAALAACRDAMAFFTIQFHSVPVVKEWLAREMRGIGL